MLVTNLNNYKTPILSQQILVRHFTRMRSKIKNKEKKLLLSSLLCENHLITAVLVLLITHLFMKYKMINIENGLRVCDKCLDNSVSVKHWRMCM